MADANYTETQVRAPGGFGKRRETPTIIVNRNGVTRQYRISPLLASFSFSVIAVFMVGYLVATAYLVLRDDLIGMTQARNARLMHEYEDRIAALRANLDRVTSRQLLDQQAIEARVEELMRRQDMLSGRSNRIGKLIDEARRRGLGSDEAAPQETGNKPDSITTGSLQTGDGINFASMGLRGSRDGKQNGERHRALGFCAQQRVGAQQTFFSCLIWSMRRALSLLSPACVCLAAASASVSKRVIS